MRQFDHYTGVRARAYETSLTDATLREAQPAPRPPPENGRRNPHAAGHVGIRRVEFLGLERAERCVV
jgi:hypothetical protein